MKKEIFWGFQWQSHLPTMDIRFKYFTWNWSANTISTCKWFRPDTASKSVMFFAGKSCQLNLQYFVTSLTLEQQLCKICSISGLWHFGSSFWINKSLNVSAKFGTSQCSVEKVQSNEIFNFNAGRLVLCCHSKIHCSPFQGGDVTHKEEISSKTYRHDSLIALFQHKQRKGHRT